MYGLNYSPIAEAADIVLVSHEHGDHNNVAAVGGNAKAVRGAGSHQIGGVTIKGVATYHDQVQGAQRGPNTVFCVELDGIRVCHLGDLGHEPGDDQAAEIGEVDLLLTPVGGNFTIDAAQASRIVDKLKPKVVIPMHFKNERCPDFPVAGVEEFTRGRPNVRVLSDSEVEFKKDQLPVGETIVLRPAR